MDIHTRKRIIAIAIGLFVLFSLLIIQYFRLQVVEYDKWMREAKGQHQRIVAEPFKRGAFYSNVSIKQGHPNTPQPFVMDVQKFHLYIDPLQIPDYAKNEMANVLIKLIPIPPEDTTNFRKDFCRKSRSRKIAMWLDFDTKKRIQTWWDKYAKDEKILRNTLFFVGDYQRSYPFERLLGQVLHTIRDSKDEKTFEGLPTGGLEMQFNELLKGKQGKRLLVHSPRNPLELGSVLEAPEDGASIYLTVNHYLQAICEEEVARGVKKAKAKCGWAIMMDPYTGEILALAQYPFFNPAQYRDYFNDATLIEHTKVKAITDANEIGSIMKPITLAVCLQANKELVKQGKAPIFSMDEKINTSNGSFPGRKRALKDTHFHANLNAYLAIRKSSNIYMAKIVDRLINTLGNEWYRDALESFGFGMKTGVELPGEVNGVLPKIGKRHRNGALEWSIPTPYSLAIGHNIQATSLQMVRAYAVFANGGFAVQPHIVRKIVKGTDVIVDHTQPTELVRIVEADVVADVVKAMKFTTKSGGTARRADIWGYTEAGKTGTAEKIINGKYSKEHFFSSFVGFAPLNHPRFVLLVAMDEPEPIMIAGVGKNSQGGVCTAPVFREIGKRTLEYLGVASDDPYGYPVGDPRYDPAKADWIKETQEIQDLYDKWNGK